MLTAFQRAAGQPASPCSGSIRRDLGNRSSAVDHIILSGDELWLDIFYFVVDEFNSSPVLNRFLLEILAVGGRARMRIAAYAIATKQAELGSQVRTAYDKANLDEDLAFTPAA